MSTSEDVRITLVQAQILSLQPGDVIVVTHPHLASRSLKEALSTFFAEHFPGHKGLLCEEGMRIEVLREASQDPAA